MGKQKRGIRQVNYPEDLEMHRLYTRGHSMVEIARPLDRSPAMIWRALLRDGLELKQLPAYKRQSQGGQARYQPRCWASPGRPSGGASRYWRVRVLR